MKMALRYITLVAILILFIINVINGATRNVKNLQHYIATEKIEAEYYTSQGWTTVYDDCTDPLTFYVGSIDDSSFLAYDDVDFGSGVKRLLLNVANVNGQTVDIAFRVGSEDNPAFATVQVDFTGGDPCTFATLDLDLDNSPTGVQDLFLTFPSTTVSALSLDWFYFNQTTSSFVATDQIQAEAFTSQSNGEVKSDCADPNVGYLGSLWNNSVIEYRNVDFGTGVQLVTVNAANIYLQTLQYIYFHVDSATSTPIVTISVGQTGSDDCDFYSLDNFLDIQPSGVRDLFLTFSSPAGSYLNVDWFQFNIIT